MNEIKDNVVDVVIEVHTQALYDEIFEAMKVFGECRSYSIHKVQDSDEKSEASSNTIAI